MRQKNARSVGLIPGDPNKEPIFEMDQLKDAFLSALTKSYEKNRFGSGGPYCKPFYVALDSAYEEFKEELDNYIDSRIASFLEKHPPRYG